MTWHELWPVLASSAVTALAWALLAFLLARPLGRVNIIDTLWPLGFCAIAVVAASAAPSNADPLRRVLLLVATLVWGLRLAWFVGRRSWGKGEDKRYADLLAKHGGHRTAVAVMYVYLPQLLILYVVSLTLQVGFAQPRSVTWLAWVGVAIWVVGLGFEAVGDHQMNRFRQNPDNHGHLIDEGLWRWTRHPNYFGDAAVWTGLFVMGADRWPGVLTVISPIVMTYLLRNGTGKRLLEQSMSARDGFAEYAQRTNGFFPLPPGLKLRLTRQAPS